MAKKKDYNSLAEALVAPRQEAPDWNQLVGSTVQMSRGGTAMYASANTIAQ